MKALRRVLVMYTLLYTERSYVLAEPVHRQNCWRKGSSLLHPRWLTQSQNKSEASLNPLAPKYEFYVITSLMQHIAYMRIHVTTYLQQSSRLATTKYNV